MHVDFVAHGLLQAGEGSKFAVTPCPGDGGLQQLRHGGGNVREVLDEALTRTTDAKEGSDVLANLGVGQLIMALIFSGCFSMPHAETTKPQKSMRGIAKRHLDILAKKFSARSLFRTRAR